MSFDDPMALVPVQMDADDVRAYEECALEELRNVLVGVPCSRPVVVENVELAGSYPDTLVVFRYHHRPESVGLDPALVDGPLVETERFWDGLLADVHKGMIDGPGMAAVYVGSAFTAAELMLADPETLRPIRRAPAIFSRPPQK